MGVLTIKTNQHHLLVSIPGLSGSCDSHFESIEVAIDNTVDRLHHQCLKDSFLLHRLDSVSIRQDAYRLIGQHLASVTQDSKWLRDCAESDLCRRVLYLLKPNKFGFEKYGWIF